MMVDLNTAHDNIIAHKSEDATRGRPYYEKLRRDLKEALDKKRELDRTLAQIENTIARSESAYLEETSAVGNIIKGFDNYIKASSAATGVGASTGTGTATRRKGGVSDQDRIFSRSSVSWITRDSPAPLIITTTGASATPSETATPGGMSAHLQSTRASSRDTPTASGPGKPNKKKKAGAASKKKEDEDGADESERPTKRGKVSWSGRD